MAAFDAEMRREALRRSRLFQELQPAELDQVLAHAAIRRFTRGVTVLRKGDPGSSVLVILHGRLRVTSTAEDGKEVMLGVLGAGDVLGEMSLLDGRERSADAIALEDCVLLIVERSHFLRLLKSSPDLCLRLMAVLCDRLRRANLALEDIALLDLPTRLGRLLLRLSQDYGTAAPHGTRIEVKLSQKDLSTLVGGSREQVNRQLRQWEQDGTIAKERGHLVLARPERLALPL